MKQSASAIRPIRHGRIGGHACHPVAVWPSASTCTHIWSHMHAARYIETQRGYIFDEHLVVCEYSMYCIVGARSLIPIVQSMDVAAAAHSLRTPGSAVPRPKSAARVVASARSSNPTTGLDSHRSTTVMDQDINGAHTFFSHQQSNQMTPTGYEPYIHVPTGRRTLVGVHHDSATGIPIPIWPTPHGYVPEAIVHQHQMQ